MRGSPGSRGTIHRAVVQSLHSETHTLASDASPLPRYAPASVSTPLAARSFGSGHPQGRPAPRRVCPRARCTPDQSLSGGGATSQVKAAERGPAFGAYYPVGLPFSVFALTGQAPAA